MTTPPLKGAGSPGNWLTVTWLIAAREITANLQNFKIPTCLGVMTFLFLLSAHLMAFDYEQRLANWSANQTAQQDSHTGAVVQYTLESGSFFHSAGVGQPAPIQRPRPLSVLVEGMERTVDRPVHVGQKLGFGSRQEENSTSVLFDTPDALFVIKVLVSLFALFFSVDAVTREKEAGTLRALLSHSLRRRHLLLGKAVGASVSLLLPFAIAQLIAIAYLFGAHGLLRESEDMMRALLILGAGLMYGLVFVHLGLFISTICTRSKSAVVIALLAWGMLVVALPDAVVLVARIISPTPSYSQLNARLHEAQQQIIEEELREHPEARSLFETPRARQAVHRAMEADRQLTDDYLARTWAQIDRARSLAPISPSGALTFGLSDLAGTGAAAFSSYISFLRDGRDMALAGLERRWDLPPEQAGSEMQEVLARVSARQRQPEPLRAGLSAALPAMASLVVWALLLGIGAYRQFDRYDVR